MMNCMIRWLLLKRGYRLTVCGKVGRISLQNTAFFDAVLRRRGHLGKTTTLNQGRLLHKNTWFKLAYTKTTRQEMVFLDPDSGFSSD